MYDTLIMLKPGASFTDNDLHDLVVAVVRHGPGTVHREGSRIRVTRGDGFLEIDRNDAAHVVEESDEIAEQFGVPCRECRLRFEMSGNDPDMELFNDLLIINERLQATGNFVIFDTQEGKLLFDEPA